jgi:putative ABC transport system permease protein
VSVADARAPGPVRSRAAAAIGSAQLFLRRVRIEPGPPLTMLALLAATCFVFAALPRLFNNVADDGLRYTVSQTPTAARNVRVLERGRLPAHSGSDPLAAVAEAAARSRQALPPPLGDLAVASTVVVRSPGYSFQPDVEASAPAAGPFNLRNVPGLFRNLTVAVHGGVEPHIRLVAGRMPASSDVRVTTRVSRPVFAETPGQFSFVSWSARVPLLEVALSTATARELRLDVGARGVFTTGQGSFDPAVQQVAVRDAQPLAIEVVGLFVVKDVNASYWYGDAALAMPNVQLGQTGDRTDVYAQALVSEDQYGSMLAATKPIALAYEFRHFLDPDRFDAGRLGALSDAVAGLESRYAGAGPLERRVETGLGPALERYGAARSQAETLLAVAAIGLLACALANIGLLGALWYARRRRETGVSRARGASPLQVLAAQAAEGVLIAAPAALVGWTVAVLVVEARGAALSAWLALSLAAATIVLLVAAIAGIARRPLGPLGRDDSTLTRTSPRRLALEGLVAVAAALGVYLLRRRGLEASPTGEGGFDPYLAGVPVLLGLACGIVALRLYPLPIRGAARLVRRARGLALHLGLSRAARQPDINAAPLLVLVLALGIACFSAAMLTTLDAGQNHTAWREVGADVRIDAPEGGTLPARLVSRLNSMGAVAPAYVVDAEIGTGGQETPIVALDLEAYERIVAGTPASVRLPRELREAPIPGLVSALVSTNWPATGTFQVPLPGQKINGLTVGDRTSFPGIPGETPFAIVPLPALEKAAGEAIPPNRLYVSGVGLGAVQEAVHDMAARAEIESRAEIVRGLRASPLVENVFRGFRAAIVLAALYAAVAVGLLALIAARSRSRDLALVLTMGASPRDALVLAAVELTPLVAIALVLGIGLGIAIPYLIAPGLDLVFFTGTSSSSIVIPWAAPAAFAAGLLVLVAAAVVVVGVRTRRAGLDRVLRIGEQ